MAALALKDRLALQKEMARLYNIQGFVREQATREPRETPGAEP